MCKEKLARVPRVSALYEWVQVHENSVFLEKLQDTHLHIDYLRVVCSSSR